MNKTTHKEILLAGFGGQGILFGGKVLSYFGLIDGKEVSWLPSYGPEMRGGTANCSVCISDKPIGSPLILTPSELIVMNSPSFDKFIDAVAIGGNVFVDNTLIEQKCERDDVNCFYIPATKLANQNNLVGLANIIMIGKFIKETNIAQPNTVKKAIEMCVPPSRSHLIEANLKAIEIGMNYNED